MQATAEIPVIEGSRKSLIEALISDVSLFGLTTMLHEVENEACKAQCFSLWNTGQILRQLCRMDKHSPNAFDAWEIFHAIPREILKSIVLRTVGYDAYQGMRGYGKNGPGIYLLSISIEGRDGRFLTWTEMETLVKNMAKYLEGARIILGVVPKGTYGHWQQKDLEAFTRGIDATYVTGRKLNDSPLFSKKDPKDKSKLSAAAELFLESLERQLGVMKALDPAGTVQTMQAPLYVGCGTVVKDRVKTYEPKPSSTIGGANVFYTLLLSLLKYQNLVPKHHVVVAARVWKKDQLKIAERLIAGFALSYPDWGGINNTEAGSSGGSDSISYEGCEKYVFLKETHMGENIRQSMEDMNHRIEAGKLIEQADTDVQAIEELEIDDIVIPLAKGLVQDLRSEGAAKAAEREKVRGRLAKLKAVEANLDGLIEALRRLKTEAVIIPETQHGMHLD